jgi:hypothetical protein
MILQDIVILGSVVLTLLCSSGTAAENENQLMQRDGHSYRAAQHGSVSVLQNASIVNNCR